MKYFLNVLINFEAKRKKTNLFSNSRIMPFNSVRTHGSCKKNPLYSQARNLERKIPDSIKCFLLSSVICLTLGSLDLCAQLPENDYQKYSYLLVGSAVNPSLLFARSASDLTNAGNYATCFFVKKGSKLFLVSAYHVITTRDVYTLKTVPTNIDYWLVRYSDTLGNLRFQQLPYYIKKLQKESSENPFPEYPDVYVIDVSDLFLDAKINFLKWEDLLIKKRRKRSENLSFFAYGFPVSEAWYYPTLTAYNDQVKSKKYEGNFADTGLYNPYYKARNLDSLYIRLSPKVIPGMSGAPIFAIDESKSKRIKLIGIQSGTDDAYNCAYVTKADALIKKIEEMTSEK
ncbi:hypothetical protein QTN47_17130 [Danxiaibacter flavus]|uniref:Serine protease n=1 Tax=Danxiaibacter flavus TaxID=3049108 RepID=A0ABV3ZJG9_9BACT|nr:hypothetical protein QNM32_17140 [Chitinophagaceae bacterium DXS]